MLRSKLGRDRGDLDLISDTYLVFPGGPLIERSKYQTASIRVENDESGFIQKIHAYCRQLPLLDVRVLCRIQGPRRCGAPFGW